MFARVVSWNLKKGFDANIRLNVFLFCFVLSSFKTLIYEKFTGYDGESYADPVPPASDAGPGLSACRVN